MSYYEIRFCVFQIVGIFIRNYNESNYLGEIMISTNAFKDIIDNIEKKQ